MKVCECCGHPVLEDGDPILGILSPMQQRYFYFVHLAGSAGIRSHELVDLMYQDLDPPQDSKVISVMKRHINARIKQFGLEVIADPPVSRMARFKLRAIKKGV